MGSRATHEIQQAFSPLFAAFYYRAPSFREKRGREQREGPYQTPRRRERSVRREFVWQFLVCRANTTRAAAAKYQASLRSLRARTREPEGEGRSATGSGYHPLPFDFYAES